MDLFIEQLVKRTKTPMDYVKIVLCLIGVFVVLSVMTLLPLIIQGAGFIIFIFSCAAIYFIYRLITNTNLEYEYCFTNGILDVDKIINLRSRKRMLEINVRKIDIMGTKNNPSFNKFMEDRGIKKVYACTDIKADDLCFMVFFDESNGKKMILFNPNEKIKEGIRLYNPGKVFLND